MIIQLCLKGGPAALVRWAEDAALWLVIDQVREDGRKLVREISEQREALEPFAETLAAFGCWP